jgi:hypothetical protein
MATVQTLITEVRRIIHDENATYRWSDNELIDYVNAGIRQIVQLVPEANTLTAAVQLTNNLARQELPSGKFIKVSHNFNDAGTTRSNKVSYCEKDVLDSYDPDWEDDTTIKADTDDFYIHYCHLSEEPKVYYVYPPCSASKYIGLVYSAIPTAVTIVSDTFGLDDEYINAAITYTVYRALTKEAQDTLPTAYRNELWENFLNTLALDKNARASVTPPRPPEGE